MFLRLWYRFCVSWLISPLLMRLVLGWLISNTVLVFAGRDWSAIWLALGVLVVTLITVHSLVVASVKELIEKNPGKPLDKLFAEITGRDT